MPNRCGGILFLIAKENALKACLAAAYKQLSFRFINAAHAAHETTHIIAVYESIRHGKNWQESWLSVSIKCLAREHALLGYILILLGNPQYALLDFQHLVIKL